MARRVDTYDSLFSNRQDFFRGIEFHVDGGRLKRCLIPICGRQRGISLLQRRSVQSVDIDFTAPFLPDPGSTPDMVNMAVGKKDFLKVQRIESEFSDVIDDLIAAPARP